MSTTVRSPSDIAVPAPAPNHQTRAGEREIVNSPKRLARIAGLLYLFVGIFGGFAEGFVDPRMYVAGDAVATAGNVLANAGVVRLGVVAHMLDGAFFIFTALTLYILLKHVQQSVARAMVVLVALATGIICLNAVFQFEALRVATDNSYAAAFGIAGTNGLVLLLLDIQHYGTLIAQVFFGLWLAPLGYLAYKSEWFPRWLGVALILAAVCYLVQDQATLAGMTSRKDGLGPKLAWISRATHPRTISANVTCTCTRPPGQGDGGARDRQDVDFDDPAAPQ